MHCKKVSTLRIEVIIIKETFDWGYNSSELKKQRILVSTSRNTFNDIINSTSTNSSRENYFYRLINGENCHFFVKLPVYFCFVVFFIFTQCIAPY